VDAYGFHEPGCPCLDDPDDDTDDDSPVPHGWDEV
jgi:hypothetical protein